MVDFDSDGKKPPTESQIKIAARILKHYNNDANKAMAFICMKYNSPAEWDEAEWDGVSWGLETLIPDVDNFNWTYTDTSLPLPTNYLD